MRLGRRKRRQFRQPIFERLERREVMDAGLPSVDVPTSAILIRTDVNADGHISPIDALLVIDAINESRDIIGTDIDADGFVVPLDALVVINRINERGGGPLTLAEIWNAPLGSITPSQRSIMERQFSSLVAGRRATGNSEEWIVETTDRIFAELNAEYSTEVVIENLVQQLPGVEAALRERWLQDGRGDMAYFVNSRGTLKECHPNGICLELAEDVRTLGVVGNHVFYLLESGQLHERLEGKIADGVSDFVVAADGTLRILTDSGDLVDGDFRLLASDARRSWGASATESTTFRTKKTSSPCMVQ